MNSESRIKYIFLDADETLLDFPSGERAALKATLEHYGLRFTDEVYRGYSDENLRLFKLLERGEIERKELVATRFEGLLSRLGARDISAADMNGYYIDRLSLCAATIDGAHEMCRELSGRYKLYIATNGAMISQMGRLKSTGLLEYMTDVFISEAIGVNKPSAEFFEYCFDKIGDRERDKYIILGDSLTSDMLGGRNAGIATCLFDSRNEVPMPHELCDYKIKQLGDFPKLLDGIK